MPKIIFAILFIPLVIITYILFTVVAIYLFFKRLIEDIFTKK
jgi:hypothetical protein